MKKWRCTICGEIVESDVRPDKCPLCKAPGEKFEEIVENGEMTWATEHVVGIAKDAPAEIIEGLRANFQGESTEVGMYLAMSRVAAENGATAGKFELAKMAKALNLDAIHDTVHEMARDEARHGRALEGLLKRYFK